MRVIFICYIICLYPCFLSCGPRTGGVGNRVTNPADSLSGGSPGGEFPDNIYGRISDELAMWDNVGIANPELLKDIRENPDTYFTEYEVGGYRLLVLEPGHQLPSLLFLTDSLTTRIIDKTSLDGVRTNNIIEIGNIMEIRQWEGSLSENIVVSQYYSGQFYQSLHEIVYQAAAGGLHEIFSLKTKEVVGMFYPEFPVILRERNYTIRDDAVYIEETKAETSPDADLRNAALPAKILGKTRYHFPLDSLPAYRDSFMLE